MIALGPRTLFVKEVRRFLRVPGQTLLSPVITTVLYLVVFGFALGGSMRQVHDVPYVTYIVPGLIMLGVISNSFLNTSSSFFMMKMQETIVDLLISPLTHVQIVGAMVAAATVRAILVGVLTWLAALVFQGGGSVPHPSFAIAFPLLTSVGFAALGLFTAIWAEKFEQVNFVPTFVITPLTFLGGVFYDVQRLPGFFATLSHFNPILYVVDGMRYALIGSSSVDPLVGLGFLVVFDAVSIAICIQVLRVGWKLRS